jgi:fructose-1,6-bisphosphatase/inositol monophosphatase family enzyme
MKGLLPEYGEFLQFAEKMADVTGPILGEAFLKRPAIEIKGDASFVTAYDKEIEKILRETRGY